jgi:hypothetical protein
MAYDHWTECVTPDKYSGPFLWSAGMDVGLIASIVVGLFDPGAGVLGLILIAIGYCRWWLYGRLVCLGGDQCVIGLALGVYSQTNQTGLGKFDTDYGVNILPAPSTMKDSISDVATTNSVQGHLLADQGSATTTPVNPAQAQIDAMYAGHDNLGFTGEPESYEDLTGTLGQDAGQGVLSQAEATALLIAPTPAAWQKSFVYVGGDRVVDAYGVVQVSTKLQPGLTGKSAPNWPKRAVPGALTTDNQVTWESEGAPGVGTIEVEFEGAGVWDLYQALLIAAPIAAAAAVVGAIPGIGWLIMLLLILAALIVAGVGAAIGLGDTATPAQDDPSIGVIHPGQDILFVMGRWIYDSAHTGWNELHPVLLCQKLGTVDHSAVAAGNPWVSHPEFGNPAELARVRDTMCALAKDGRRPPTTVNQTKPEHLWTLHPSVDGCQPGDAPHDGNGDPIHLT